MELDRRSYYSAIVIINVFQGFITYLNSTPNYNPVVDILLTVLLAFLINAFISFVIFLLIGLYKRSFPMERFIKTFATWSFVYMLIIVIDAFML